MSKRLTVNETLGGECYTAGPGHEQAPMGLPFLHYHPKPEAAAGEERGDGMSKRLTVKERLLRGVSEKEWQASIVAAIRKVYGHRALVFHVYNSKESDEGFWDLTVILPPAKPGGRNRMFLWECKTETGTVSEAQSSWLSAAHEAVLIEARVMRPSDVDHLMQVLGVGG